MNINASAGDIRAKHAYDGTSYSPERREASVIADYLAHMTEVAMEFTAWETAENAAAMTEDFEAYRTGYAARLNAYLSSHSRVVSQFVTGSGGWTGRMVRTNEKRNDTVDRRLNELVEWSSARLEKLRNRYDPRAIGRRAIRTGDADALERLTEKIERLENFQEAMKRANKIIRSKLAEDEKIDALVTIDGIAECQARKLLRGDSSKRLGFPSYALTNNGANIRRLKERYAEIEHKQAQDKTNGARRWDFNGGYVLDNPEADRYQVYHDQRPASDVLAKLKQCGLRWTPSQGCWQAYRTPNGAYAVQKVTGIQLT